jgi:hypothetical protein
MSNKTRITLSNLHGIEDLKSWLPHHASSAEFAQRDAMRIDRISQALSHTRSALLTSNPELAEESHMSNYRHTDESSAQERLRIENRVGEALRAKTQAAQTLPAQPNSGTFEKITPITENTELDIKARTLLAEALGDIPADTSSQRPAIEPETITPLPPAGVSKEIDDAQSKVDDVFRDSEFSELNYEDLNNIPGSDQFV